MPVKDNHIQPLTFNPVLADQLLNLVTPLASFDTAIFITQPNGEIITANTIAKQLLKDTSQGDDISCIKNLFKENASPEDWITDVSDPFSKGILEIKSLSRENNKFNFKISNFSFEDQEFKCVLLNHTSTTVNTTSEKYQPIFEENGGSICVLDLNGIILDLNKSALHLIQNNKNEIIGQPISNILGLTEEEATHLNKSLIKVKEGKPHELNWFYKYPNGEQTTIQTSFRKGDFSGLEVIVVTFENGPDQAFPDNDFTFKNQQLELLNFLLTQFGNYHSPAEILKFTLDQLIQKTSVLGGGIYILEPIKEQYILDSLLGNNGKLLPRQITKPAKEATNQNYSENELKKVVKNLNDQFKPELDGQPFTLLPIITENKIVSFILLFIDQSGKVEPTFNTLIQSISIGLSDHIGKTDLHHKLIGTENKYEALFETSNDAILLLNHQLIIDCNFKASALFGYSKENLIGSSLWKILPIQNTGLFSGEHKDRQMMAFNILSKEIAPGQSEVFEWKHTQADGNELDLEITVFNVQIDSKPYRQLIIRDVTEVKQAVISQRREEVLRESVKHFRDFLGKIEMAYVSVDLQGNITYINNYFLEFTGYTREEVIGVNYFYTFVPESEQQDRLQNFFEMIRSRLLVNYNERDIETKTGTLKTLRWQRMFDFDQDGNITGVTSLGRDVTDKKVAMEALRDNKSRLQDIFDNAHDLIQNTSIDNKFIFVNKAWKEKLGYDDFDIEKLSLNDIVHPYYKAKLIYQLRNLYKGEHVNKIETVFLTKSGKPVHLIGSINCTWQNGKPVLSRAILHDITDRIKAERLQKVYYSIANLAISSKDLNSLYGAIHRELSKIIETNNIFIALCDDDKTSLQFVYYIDQFNDEIEKVSERPFSNGISEYVIKTGKPLFLLRDDILELEEKGVLKLVGKMPEVMLCSPLSVGDRIIGIIAVQDYKKSDIYVNSDVEILHFISNQVALAIERKRNEVQINNQNARLKAIFESGSHQIWSINKDSQLTSFNQNYANAFFKRHGYMPQFNIDLRETRRINTSLEVREEWNNYYDKALQGEPQHFEMDLIQLDGSTIWREIYLNPIYLEDGSFEEVSGIALDITEQKLSRMALAKEEEKFRSIFESFQDLYYRTDQEGKVVLMSPSVREILGYEPDDVIGMPAVKMHANPEDRERLVQKIKFENTTKNFETNLISKNGEVIPFLINAHLLTDKEGNATGIEGVGRDMTEMKQAELELIRAKDLAEQSLQAKSLFLANMSHELRTPMNGIIGMIDLLHSTAISEEQTEYIDTLRKSSDALLTILNDILDLSKIQAGKLQLNETGIDLHYALEKIHSLFANKANQKDLDFSYKISEHTPQFIITDETRLLQILSNLTSNAIKFTNAGKVTISVNSIYSDGELFTIMFRIKDSGIGITDSDKKLLFTNFTQLDNTSTKTFGGTGLGLAISKELSELLGGEIGVESIYGEGSTFWFTIQCRIAHNNQQILNDRQTAREQYVDNQVFTDQPYVLLVDDNNINQKVAQKLLAKLGCRIEVASNGFEAINMATTHNYEIIFMDIQMPEMDGVEATGHIKRQLAKNCPPIIAMTAYSMKDDAEKFIAKGLDDYVSKPIKGNDLFQMIQKWRGSSNPVAPTEIPEPPAVQETEDANFIDEEVVDQLIQMAGKEFAEQLYLEFEQETEPLLEEAKKEVDAKQYPNILSTLHQIKGTSSTLGLNPIADIVRKLEHDIRQDKYNEVDQDFNLLLTYFNQYKTIYPKKFI